MAMAECRSWEAVGPRKVSAVVGVYARRKVREPITAPCVSHSRFQVFKMYRKYLFFKGQCFLPPIVMKLDILVNKYLPSAENQYTPLNNCKKNYK